MLVKDGETRLNTDIPKELKRDVKKYCAQEDVKLKEVTEMALEYFLKEMGFKRE